MLLVFHIFTVSLCGLFAYFSYSELSGGHRALRGFQMTNAQANSILPSLALFDNQQGQLLASDTEQKALAPIKKYIENPSSLNGPHSDSTDERRQVDQLTRKFGSVLTDVTAPSNVEASIQSARSCFAKLYGFSTLMDFVSNNDLRRFSHGSGMLSVDQSHKQRP